MSQWRVSYCYWLHQLSCPSLSIQWRGGEEPYSCFDADGTLKGLILAHFSNLSTYVYDYKTRRLYEPATPAGIWIDRIEECPEELVGATAEQVTALLTYLRAKHPNGV